jgi:hypothetical protein
MRDYVTRQEYDSWINECAALAVACGFPIRDSMVNDNSGVIFGADQYAAFDKGMWSREPYEAIAIFDSINEPAIEGLPHAAMDFAEYGGLCEKLIVVHPGKFCSAHLHWRKTEYYEVVLGEADILYAPEIVDFPDLGVNAAEVIERTPMPQGDPRPSAVRLPEGREQAWALLTSYQRVRKGDPKFVVPRKHLHGFGCPADARTPLVIRENSTYNHEPTEASKAGQLPEWQHIHDNAFMHPGVAESRLGNNIREG